MGVTRMAVHLPLHRIDDKELQAAGLARGFESLRVPWWDEDPLTMAIEVGLQLQTLPVHLERIHLALDAPTDQAGLAALALGVDVPVVQHVGPDAGLEALLAADPGPSLVLAGGAELGGAGVAALLEPAQGAPLGERTSARGGPLSSDSSAVLRAAVDQLDWKGPLLVPSGRVPAPALPADRVATVGRQVGDAGAAGALLELAGSFAGVKGPRRLASVAHGTAIAVGLDDGKVRLSGLDGPVVATTVPAWRAMTNAEAEPWAEAAQGAYVSIEEYEADPIARYGCRAMGHATVETVTTIAAGAPGEFLRQHDAAGPYDVAIVSTAEGARRIVQSGAQPGALRIGDEVRPVLRRLFSLEGRVRYAIKVKPASADGKGQTHPGT